MRTSASPPPPAPPSAPALGQAAARGFSWLLGQTLGTKAINTAVQIILAWLLTREEFGLIGLAYTVTAFVSVLQRAGLQEILIHRHVKFNRWANAAFWMSLALGCCGMLLIWAAIPLAVRIYHEPKLAGLLAVLSINSVLGSLLIVPQAKLSNALRFRVLALVTVAAALLQAIVACLLAWMGWGAQSIAVSAVAGVAAQGVLMWSFAPHRLMRKMHLRRWRFMMTDSVAMLGTGILWVITAQGDYMVLGIFHTAALTGLYYFAFNLSMQTISLFTGNLESVLFPTLSKLQDEPERQTESFIRATRLLALIVIPACLLQAAIADPLIRMIFPAKWYPAIPVMQILCVGMAFRAAGSPGWAMMRSQGRFRTMFVLSCIYTAAYLFLVTAGAVLGGIVSVAIAESIYFVLMSPVHLYAAIVPGGKSWKPILQIYLPPLVGSIAALLPGWAIAYTIPHVAGQHLIRFGVALAIGGPLYFLIMRRVSPVDCVQLRQRFTSIIRYRSDLRNRS